MQEAAANAIREQAAKLGGDATILSDTSRDFGAGIVQRRILVAVKNVVGLDPYVQGFYVDADGQITRNDEPVDSLSSAEREVMYLFVKGLLPS